MKGFSLRNLKYMRAFAAAWPKRALVQEALAQLPPNGAGMSGRAEHGWETEIVNKLPKDLQGSLPTVEEIKAELQGEREGDHDES